MGIICSIHVMSADFALCTPVKKLWSRSDYGEPVLVLKSAADDSFGDRRHV